LTKKLYEVVEHTADIGIRVFAKDLKELFSNSALAMFDIMTKGRLRVKGERLKVKDVIIKQRAENLEELFVNWLNELLSLSATKNLIFVGFNIDKLSENEIEARLSAEEISSYKIETEIKAATYSDLKIEKQDSGYSAEVIFDV
jgi:SHS2 domain-containing protein